MAKKKGHSDAEFERSFSAHHLLIESAKRALNGKTSDTTSALVGALSAIVFSALALEAIANAVGERVIPDWLDFQSLSPGAKLRMLAEHLDVPYSSSAAPWDTVRWLGRFRNRIVHAKPERIRAKGVAPESDVDLFLDGVEVPISKIEADITIQNAQRAFAAVKSVLRVLCANISPEKRIGLLKDQYTMRTPSLGSVVVSSAHSPSSDGNILRSRARYTDAGRRLDMLGGRRDPRAKRD